jgi:hypothetical protein
MGGFDRPGKRALSTDGEVDEARTSGVPGKRTLTDAAYPALVGKGNGTPVAPEVRAAAEPVIGRSFDDVAYA